MLAFILGCVYSFGMLVTFSALSIVVPWFRRWHDREEWERETPAQRFFWLFNKGIIAHLVLIFLYIVGWI